MFIGHYSAAFAAKRVEPEVPLWVFFLAVQLVDVLNPVAVLGAAMILLQVYAVFGPAPDAIGAVVGSGLVAYLALAGAARFAEGRFRPERKTS